MCYCARASARSEPECVGRVCILLLHCAVSPLLPVVTSHSHGLTSLSHGAVLGKLAEQTIEAVQQFLREHVANYVQLEALLLLRDDQARQWTALEVSQRLKTADDLVESALQALSEQSLLELERGADCLRFRYAPASAALSAAVESLANAYEHQRWLVVEIMSRSALERVRTAAHRLFGPPGRR